MLTLLKPETSIGGSDVYDAIKPVVKQFQRTLSEQQIVILLQQRNQQGVSALYDKYASVVYGLIYRIIGRKDFAENALQDTFLKVWQNIETYDVSKGRFLSWILKIARNAAIDVKRSKPQGLRC